VSVDLVTANMVVEHAEDPAALFAEVDRVLRPGGSFLVHTNSSGYTTRLTKLIPEGLRPGLAKRAAREKGPRTSIRPGIVRTQCRC
jgi:ubiquinone/menaquinone biosynthesis C-methylase UbiE